jgi:hypothetical protein
VNISKTPAIVAVIPAQARIRFVHLIDFKAASPTNWIPAPDKVIPG